MKKFEWQLQNTIYLILTIGVIIAFLIVFRIDQLARCTLIATNGDFYEVSEQVYVSNHLKEKEENILAYLEEARSRNTELYGYLEDKATYIFASSQEEAESFRGSYVGVTHYSAFGLFVIIGPSGMNDDVVSHEMAHGEVAARIGWYKNNKLPIWFNEGLATQVDLRDQFSLSEWQRLTDSGNDIFEIKNLDTPDEFYDFDIDTRIDNYLFAKHEVKKWLDLVGDEGLNTLMAGFADGEDFNNLYSELLLESVKKVNKESDK